MSMGEPSLLPLDRIEMSTGFTENLVVRKPVDKATKFKPKHSANQVISIGSGLSGETIASDLVPFWIACECDKKI